MARGYIATSSGGVTSDETTVTKDKVLIGETYLGADTDDEVGTGIMPNNGAMNGTLNAGQSKNIPAGYTTGGTITANSLASQTPANATAAYILNPYTAWVNGSRLTGSMTNYSGKTSTSNYVSSNFRSGTTNYIFASPGATGYFTSGTYLRIPATNLAAGNIKKGVTILGITGTFEGYVSSPLYLFRRGTIITGQSISFGDSSDKLNGDHIEVYSGSYFNNFIDLTSYKFLKFIGKGTYHSCTATISILNSSLENIANASGMVKTGTEITIFTDISALNGLYRIYLNGGVRSGVKESVNYYEIYLSNI